MARPKSVLAQVRDAAAGDQEAAAGCSQVRLVVAHFPVGVVLVLQQEITHAQPELVGYKVLFYRHL